MGLCQQCRDTFLQLIPIPLAWKGKHMESIELKAPHLPCGKCGKIQEERK